MIEGYGFNEVASGGSVARPETTLRYNGIVVNFPEFSELPPELRSAIPNEQKFAELKNHGLEKLVYGHPHYLPEPTSMSPAESYSKVETTHDGLEVLQRSLKQIPVEEMLNRAQEEITRISRRDDIIPEDQAELGSVSQQIWEVVMGKADVSQISRIYSRATEVYFDYQEIFSTANGLIARAKALASPPREVEGSAEQAASRVAAIG